MTKIRVRSFSAFYIYINQISPGFFKLRFQFKDLKNRLNSLITGIPNLWEGN